MQEFGRTLTTLSAVLSRIELLRQLSSGSNTFTELMNLFRYPVSVTYDDCLEIYRRGDIAAALIDKPVSATWKDVPSIEEKKGEVTLFESAFTALAKRLRLWSVFKRLDKLTMLGRYGVLLLGFNDADDFSVPVNRSPNLELVYITPYGEGSVNIVEWDTDRSSPRYNLPVMYSIKGSVAGRDNVELKVHYTRVIHVVYDELDSEVYGTPYLQKVFNRLLDLTKLAGGSAEMFWRGARPGYAAVLDSNAVLTPEDRKALKEQLDEFENNLRRWLTVQGIDIKSLQTQVSDPSNHIDVQISLIAAATGIPKRILTGSERGELASTQDERAWANLIQERRALFAEQRIIRPFIDRLLELGVLPSLENPEEGYTVDWPPISVLTDKEKAEIGKLKAQALAAYFSVPGPEDVVPPEFFLRKVLGFTREDIQEIEESVAEE